MIFNTLNDAVAELRPRINGGTCKFETAVARINQATRRILNRPRKPVHIERVIRFFTRKDTITLPREVEKIKHYGIDGRPSPLFSQAYEFVSGGWGELGCDPCIPGRYLVDRGNQYSTMFDLPSMGAAPPRTSSQDSGEPGPGWQTSDVIRTQAELSALAAVPGTESGAQASLKGSVCEPEFSHHRLVAFSTAEADRGKELVLHGVNDKNEALGSPLPGERLVISAWDGGVEGAILMDLASQPRENFTLSGPVRDIHRVQKPETDGFVSLYSYDEVTHQMYFLSKYHPQETNPRYRRYRITTPDYCDGQSIYALCELGYIPLEHPDDVLIVQNMDALKMMVMAIEFENERDFQQGKAYEADAYRLIEDQRTSERTHDYNLVQVASQYGYGDIRAL